MLTGVVFGSVNSPGLSYCGYRQAKPSYISQNARQSTGRFAFWRIVLTIR
jgi:hypothetical protein